MTGDDRVQQIALVSQRNAEDRHKNTIFAIRRSNSNSGLRKFEKHLAIGDLPVRWAFGVDTAVVGCLLARDQWFELTNESAECNLSPCLVTLGKCKQTPAQ